MEYRIQPAWPGQFSTVAAKPYPQVTDEHRAAGASELTGKPLNLKERE